MWPFLRVWEDTSHSADSRFGKVYTLDELKITEIGVHFTQSDQVDGYGNQLKMLGLCRHEWEEGKSC